MKNVLENRFNPTGFQTEQNGTVHLLTDLSRDDLVQVACEQMVTVERLGGLFSQVSDVMNDWLKGTTKRDPEPIDEAIQLCTQAEESLSSLIESSDQTRDAAKQIKALIDRLKSGKQG